MDEIVNEYGELLELNSYAEKLTSDKNINRIKTLKHLFK